VAYGSGRRTPGAPGKASQPRLPRPDCLGL